MTMHDHGHDHSHLIEHSDVRVRGRLILVMCFTLVVVAAQITGSILTSNLALLAASDAQNEAQNDVRGDAENGPQAPRADLAARITP